MKKISMLTVCSLLIATAGFDSCITRSDELDLDKKLSLDMQIGAGGMSLPLGSLEKIYIDSLLKTGGSDIDLDTLPGGAYGITMSNDIPEVNVNIDKISINIPNPSIAELKTSFDNPTPDDINVPKVTDGTVVEISSVNVDAINDRLPELKSSYETASYSIPGAGVVIPVEKQVTISEQSIAFKFDYTLPDKVKRLNNVWFGKTRYSKSGQTLMLNVDLSGIYNVIDDPTVSIESLSMVFPSNFTVEKSSALDSYISSANVTATGNTFAIAGAQVSGVSKSSPVLPVSFTVSNADFSAYEGAISFDDKITYSLVLNIQGNVSFSDTRTFKVGVSLEDRLQMAEISADTKAVNFDVSPASISSAYSVTGMEGISSINRLTFVPESSKIYLQVSDLELDPFLFSSTEGGIALQFQPNIQFENSCKDENGETAGKWDTEVPGKLIVDLGKASGHTIELNVLSLDLSEYEIDSQTKKMSVQNTINYGGTAVIDVVENLGLAGVETLGNRNFNVSVWGSLTIDNAELVTEALSTEIKDSTTISINEKVDASLVSLKKIELVKPSGVHVNLVFSGIPETLPELAFSDVRIEFPDFIKMNYAGNDSRIQVIGANVLRIDGNLKPSEMKSDGFSIDGLRIESIEFNDYVETVNGRLVLNDLKVSIDGGINTDNFTVNSNELEDVAVKPTISIDPVEVKAVYGKFSPSIDPIHESVGLSLGENMDFFKDGNNSLCLNNPEFVFNLKSTVTIPIVADMKLASKDIDGNYIARDIMPEGGSIRIPACAPDADSRDFTMIVYTDNRDVTDSDDTVYVRIANLTDLMKTIPDTVIVDFEISADQSVNHYIDLTRALSVQGSYDVKIPLSFKNIHIEYSDTIADLGDQLSDISDKIGDASLRIKAKLESTVPFGITLSATALDADGKPIKDITIGTCEAKPGNSAGTPSDVVFAVSAKNGSLAVLDALKINASFDSGDSEDGSTLKKGQYLWLKDIVIQLPEGIVIDLTETDDNK